MKRLYAGAAILAFSAAGCASKAPALMPDDTPVMYAAHPAGNDCTPMVREVLALNEGLGEPAAETPIPPPATAWARMGAYARDLVVQTAIGPLQPAIQTVRALTNAESKSAAQALGRERALIRRAYLMGKLEASGCPVPLAEPPAVLTSAGD